MVTNSDEPNEPPAADRSTAEHAPAVGGRRHGLRSRRGKVSFVLASVLLCGITLALVWNVRAAPDEASHVAVATHYVHDQSILTSEDFAYSGQRGHAYYLLSPVPYLGYVPFAWAQEENGPVKGAARPGRVITRLGGLPYVVAQLFVTVLIFRRMAPQADGGVVVAAATVVNLVPQLRYLHAYVNSDSMAVLAGSVGFLMCLRLLQTDRLDGREAVLVGATVSLIALSRLNAGLIAVPLVLIFVVGLWRSDHSWRVRCRLAAITVVVVTWVAAPFHLYIYNELDNGSLLPTDTVMELGDSSFDGAIPEAPPLGEIIEERRKFVSRFWLSAWLRIEDGPSLDGNWSPILAIAVLAGLVGLATTKQEFRTPGARLVGLTAAACFVLTYLTIASEWLYGQQGRFLIPAGITALAGVVLGTAELLRRTGRLGDGLIAACVLWGGLLLSMNVWALNLVI